MYKLRNDKNETHLRTALNRMLQYCELDRLLCGGVVYYYKADVYVQVNYLHNHAQKANFDRIHTFLSTCCYEIDDIVPVTILSDPNMSLFEIGEYCYISEVRI